MTDRSERNTLQARVIWTRLSPFPAENQSQSSVLTYGPWTDYRTGSSDPEWKKKVQMNVDATGPMTAETQTCSWSVANCTHEWYSANAPYTPYVDTLRGVAARGRTYVWSPGDWLDVFTTADNRALVKLHRAIQEETTTFKGGTFLGELRETIKMIRRPAAALRDGLEKYLGAVVQRATKAASSRKRKRKGLSPLELQRIIAGTWLEYSFGWVPFVNDVKDLASVFAHDGAQYRRSKARGHGYAEKAIVYKFDDTLQYLSIPTIGWGTVYRRCRIVYRAGLSWEAAAPFGTFRRLHELAGFRFREFIPTVWELIPYSWAVDYFTNIGELLECTATDTSSVRWVNRTAIYENIDLNTLVADTRKAKLNTWQGRSTITGADLGWFQSYFKRVSRISTGVLYPTVQFRMPPLESAKWLNLAALHLLGKSSSEALRGLLRHG